MAATIIAGSASLNFTLTRAITGFDTISKAFSVILGSDIAVATYTDVYAAQLSIASGDTTTVDLYGSLTDFLGNAFSAKTKLAAMIIKVTGGTGCSLVVKPGASNGISGWLGGTSPTLTIGAPGSESAILYHKFPTHLTISNSAKNIAFEASGGSGTLTVNVAFVLG